MDSLPGRLGARRDGSRGNLLRGDATNGARRRFRRDTADPKSRRLREYLIPVCVVAMLLSCMAAMFAVPFSSRGERAPEGRIRSPLCARVPEQSRFDCHPEEGADEASCAARGCCWNAPRSVRVSLGVPYCYYPENWSIYAMVNRSESRVFYRNVARSAYPDDVPLLRMDLSAVGDSIFRARIVDAREKRFEPPLPIVPNPATTRGDWKFRAEADPRSPGFRVDAIGQDAPILSTGGGFIFADQFLQTSLLLPNGSLVYGLGEHATSLKLDTNWRSLTMFNRDLPPTENANLYGSHPFALIMRQPGIYAGLLFLNGNAMEIVLQPTPAITFRSIGGIFDAFVFLGPSASDVVKQYSEIVGKPFMPPYWSLGFHLCRYGYGSLEGTERVWNRTRTAGIPFDTQWNDLDYMRDNNDFTYDSRKFGQLPRFVERLHEAGMRYVPLIDAGVSGSEVNGSYRPFDEGARLGVFVKEANSEEPFRGKVWNRGSTVWPDFTNPATADYWRDMMEDMWRMFPYDGAWIDMNEPSNFYDGRVDGCEKNRLDDPVYVPRLVGNRLASKTLCMNARHHLGSHYDLHNSHGIGEAAATNRALVAIRRARPFVISRSTWVGLGSYAGHWSGDVYSTWRDMRMSVPQLLSFGLFQIPMMGADICGFNGNTTESLCNRWSQLGAFYPFSRNHNSDDTVEQDPVAMGQLVVESARKALEIRYGFLPYLYTLFFRAHSFGETVARPLFFEFSNDPATWDLDSQFLWGSSLMILPVFEEGATRINAYVPRGTWYDFYDKQRIISEGRNYTLEAPLDTIPLLVRGGSILVGQTPGGTTTDSRKNPFELLIALDHLGRAIGELYWDDGDDTDAIEKSNYRWWEFKLENRTVRSREMALGKYTDRMILGKIRVMGVEGRVDRVTVNGMTTRFSYDERRSYLSAEDLGADLTKELVLSWE